MSLKTKYNTTNFKNNNLNSPNKAFEGATILLSISIISKKRLGTSAIEMNMQRWTLKRYINRICYQLYIPIRIKKKIN